MIRVFIATNLKAILAGLLAGFLVVWNISATVVLLRNKVRVMVIRVSEQGTQVIEEAALSKRSNQDIFNMVNTFVTQNYSYTNDTFETHKIKALELLSPDLFESEHIKALEDLKSLGDRIFSQEAIIEAFDHLGNGVVQLDIKKNIVENSAIHTVKSKLTISLRPITRFKENPYGYEITNIIEEKRF